MLKMILKYSGLVALAAANDRLFKDYTSHPQAEETAKIQLDVQNEWRENLVKNRFWGHKIREG